MCVYFVYICLYITRSVSTVFTLCDRRNFIVQPMYAVFSTCMQAGGMAGRRPGLNRNSKLNIAQNARP